MKHIEDLFLVRESHFFTQWKKLLQVYWRDPQSNKMQGKWSVRVSEADIDSFQGKATRGNNKGDGACE